MAMLEPPKLVSGKFIGRCATIGCVHNGVEYDVPALEESGEPVQFCCGDCGLALEVTPT